MAFAFSSRSRAGVLVLALALVGGTGCMTMMAVEKMQTRMDERAVKRARLDRIAELEPAAAAGNPQAMTALAFALMGVYREEDQDVPRALGLLERAAAQNDAQAQAILGTMLVTGKPTTGAWTRLPSTDADRDRGIDLLKAAATQACVIDLLADPKFATYLYPHLEDKMDVAARLVELFGDPGHPQPLDARLWQARDIVECGSYRRERLVMDVTNGYQAQSKIDALAMLMLTRDAAAIATAQARLTPQMIAAAEQGADELRRLVAESERRYPAPARKTIP